MRNLPLIVSALSLASVFAGCGPNDRPEYVGTARWAVLKCKYSDVATVPTNDEQRLDQLFNGEEGVREYFGGISHGNYVPDFDISPEWKTMDLSTAQDAERKLSRYDRTVACMNAHGVPAGKYDGVIAAINADIDAGYQGNVLLSPGAWSVSFLGHEMLHHLGLSHSWDTSTRKNSDWSSPGEYFDFWDIMSAMAIWGFDNANHFTAGPDLATPFKLRLGWLSPTDDVTVYDWKAGGTALETLSLRPYSEFTGANKAAACADSPDSGGFTRYCVEYRVKAGWDRAIPASGVLVHFLKNNDAGQNMTLAIDHALVTGEHYTSPDGMVVVTIGAITEQSATVTLARVGATVMGTSSQGLTVERAAPVLESPKTSVGDLPRGI